MSLAVVGTWLGFTCFFLSIPGAFLASIGISPLWAGDVPDSTFSAVSPTGSITQTISVPQKDSEGQFLIVVTLKQCQVEKVRLPEVEGLTVGRPSSSVSFNGSSQVISYDTRLKPTHPGDFTIPAFDLRDDDGHVYHLRAMRLHVSTQAGDPDTASIVSSSAEAVTIAPQAPPEAPPEPKTYEDFYRLTGVLYGKHDYEGAMKAIGQAIALQPNQARTYGYRALMRREHGDWEGALADYNECVRLDPLDALAWKYRGNARKLHGDLDDAIADYEQALRLKLDPQERIRTQADLEALKAVRKKPEPVPVAPPAQPAVD